MATVPYPHIDYTDGGVPIIARTNTKVVEVVLDHLAYRWNAEEIQRQHAHLSLAQIHGALSYYFDNQAEIDRDIEQRMQKVNEIKSSLGESPIQLKLKAFGLLS